MRASCYVTFSSQLGFSTLTNKVLWTSNMSDRVYSAPKTNLFKNHICPKAKFGLKPRLTKLKFKHRNSWDPSFDFFIDFGFLEFSTLYYKVWPTSKLSDKEYFVQRTTLDKNQSRPNSELANEGKSTCGYFSTLAEYIFPFFWLPF